MKKDSSNNELPHIKCVAVGDGSVGKTCLLLVYANDEFPEKYVPTVFDNYSCNIKVDGKDLNLSLWDTAGQEGYDFLRPLSYAQTHVFLLCFSTVEHNSFVNIKQKWYPEIKKHAPQSHQVLVGTKSDLLHDQDYRSKMLKAGQKFITYQEGVKLAKELDCYKYIECSAKEKINLKFVFDTAIRAALHGKPKKQGPNCILL